MHTLRTPADDSRALLPGAISDSDVLDELQRIVSSRLFVRSVRLSRFLRYTVQHSLAARAAGVKAELKEYSVGLEVFDRKSFDPRIDPIVRVEARRLRAKLRSYYQSEGREDAIVIGFHKGSYSPVFRRRAEAGRRKSPALPAIRLRLGEWQRDLTAVIEEARASGQPAEVACCSDTGDRVLRLQVRAGQNGIELVFRDLGPCSHCVPAEHHEGVAEALFRASVELATVRREGAQLARLAEQARALIRSRKQIERQNNDFRKAPPPPVIH